MTTGNTVGTPYLDIAFAEALDYLDDQPFQEVIEEWWSLRKLGVSPARLQLLVNVARRKGEHGVRLGIRLLIDGKDQPDFIIEGGLALI